MHSFDNAQFYFSSLFGSDLFLTDNNSGSALKKVTKLNPIFESLWFYHVFLVISVSYATFNFKGSSYTIFRLKLYSCILVLRTKKISKQYEKSARNQKYDTSNKVLK